VFYLSGEWGGTPLPTMSPARQSARAHVFRGRRLSSLSPAGRYGGAPRRHSRLGLLPVANHIHLIVTPADADGLRASFAEAHRRYTGAINARFRWTGHLFQGRFGAVVMGEPHLLASARYIALNPVVAGPVSGAEDWPWSSTRAQLAGEDDELATVGPLRALIPDFAALLPVPTDAATTTRIERAPRSVARLGGRNGLRCSSAGSAALWRPANPAQREPR
jgi:putative transposase